MAKLLYDKIAGMLEAAYVVRHEDPLTLSDSEPEPDISVVQGGPRAFLESHPRSAVTDLFA